MNATSKPAFRTELKRLLNCHSAEQPSNTPDFLLAEFLTDCLDAFDRTVATRERWYGREPKPVPPHQCPNPPTAEELASGRTKDGGYCGTAERIE